MPRLLFVVPLMLLASPVMGRELHWESIEVKARLDGEAKLHVVERQRFVFSGDWNGGERRFRLEDGQALRFGGIRRIDDSGAPVRLTPGDLSRVDQYRLEGGLLRWRSRLPTDPEFANTLLTYEIEYVLTGVLGAVRAGDEHRYLLNHDFAFADRPGNIERFTLDLELDASWRTVERVGARIATGRLAPGESFVVRRDLVYTGSKPPQAEYLAASPFVRSLTIAAVLAGLPTIFGLFWLGERARGRFVRPKEAVDESWLEKHILSELPEVVGYMYDNKSGPPEVAAILARLTQEGSITSSVERRRWRAPLLRMTRQDTGRDLLAQEQQLVHLFFVDRSDETDTDRIRKHYKKRGFDPGSRIRESLVSQALRNGAWRDDPPPDPAQDQTRILTGAYALLFPGALFGFYNIWLMIYMAVLGGIACAVGRAIAVRSADKVRALPLWWLAASVPTLLVAWMLTSVAKRDVSHVKEAPFLIAAVFLLTVYWFVMKGARTKESAEKMLLRARIAAARGWFAQQLRKQDPALRDDWTPYLIALGLGRNVDRWFASFGGEAPLAPSSGWSSTPSSSDPSVPSSSSSAGRSVSTWSGGGGAFGGAGATGSWALAATSLGSGSSAPVQVSSSGGSGGGSSSSSSSSSSSGGGGGGGW
jgi:uncharacterized membrane protein YgcG